MHIPAFPGSRGRWRAAALSLAAGFLCSTSAPAAAPDALVIGDSLGVGVSMASGLSRLARNSVAIRGGSVLGQIKQAPSGSVVFMSLGTNDAVGRIDGLDGDIGRIITASSGVKLVWIGPPCVLKPWDTNAEKLDGILRARTAGTGVTYVSMRDSAMCAPGSRAKDGVHFTMAGYGLMWSKARLAAGYEGGRTMVASATPSKKATRRKTARKKKAVKVASAEAPASAASGPASTSSGPSEAPRKKRAPRRVTADAER